jgi:hypothetical protein
MLGRWSRRDRGGHFRLPYAQFSCYLYYVRWRLLVGFRHRARPDRFPGRRILRGWSQNRKGSQILTWTKAVVSPRLSILRSDEQMILSWLIPSTRFALQQTPSLAHPAWTDVATQPGWNYKNLNQKVSLPTQAGPVFFRLVSR